MATKSSTQTMENLVINKVASSAVYADMVSNNQINENELYLVAGDETVSYTLSQSGNTITLTGTDGSTSSVSADQSGAASSAVSAHNSSTTAHPDIRNAIPTTTSQLTNDSGFITTGDIPEGAAASTTLPIMDGTATTGTELAFARGDHIHPTDTSRAAAVHTHAASDITSGLATVATSGLYTDLSGKPSIPDSTSDLTNDSGFITSSDIPVTSVNSKMGAVSLTYSDVGAAASSHGTHVTFDSINNPKMDGTAAKGTATTVARSDHVHPTDTSRASASDLSTHTGNTTIHITASERTAWNAKAETSDIPTKTSNLTNDSGFITTGDIPEGASASTTSPKMDGTATVGTELAFARGDHIHPTDTSRAPTNHASTATTYGSGTANNYGHVKLSDSTSGTSTAASGGTAATPKAVSDALSVAKSYADGVSDNNFTDTLKSKLDGIETGAQVNAVTSVNSKTGAVSLTYSDVGAAASSHGMHVTYSTTAPVMDGTASVGSATTVARSDHVHPTDTSRAAASHTHSASDITSGLATVATSGSYTDLSNKPFIPAGTVTSVAAGTGLTGGTITESGTIALNLASDTPLTNAATSQTSTSGRTYPLSLDSNGNLAVNVPWNNTTYSPQALGFGYAVCTSLSSSVFTATLSGFVLRTNGHVSVYFPSTVPSGATLNINNTGAKPIYYNQTAITAGVIPKGRIATFVYDGTNYILIALDKVVVAYTGSGSVLTAASATGNVITFTKGDLTYTDVGAASSSDLSALEERVQALETALANATFLITKATTE